MNYALNQILKLSMLLLLLTIPYTLKAEVVNRILANVGDKIITSYDIQSIDNAQYKKILDIDDDDLRNETIKTYTEQVLDFLINQYLVEIAAAREGIKVTDQEVELAINDILVRNNLDIKQLEESILAEGVTFSKYRYQLKNEILNVRIRNNILMPKILVVDKDLIDIVNSDPEEYSLYNHYEVRLILTSTKNELSLLLKDIETEEEFISIARLHSDDPTSSDGGYMGSLELELLEPYMQEALEGAEVGELTEIFQHNNQWATFYVISKTDKYNFDDTTRATLMEKAMEKQFNLVFANWLERNKATIVVIKNNLD